MKNSDIVAITSAYIKEKEQPELDRKDGLYPCRVALPAPIAWKKRLNFKALFEARRTIDEALAEIDQGYSDDEHSEMKDKIRMVKPEFLAEFTKKKTEILEQETDVVIKKVKIEDLGDTLLTDEDLDTLMFMIEEE